VTYSVEKCLKSGKTENLSPSYKSYLAWLVANNHKFLYAFNLELFKKNSLSLGGGFIFLYNSVTFGDKRKVLSESSPQSSSSSNLSCQSLKL
jgi:hypothetical protein